MNRSFPILAISIVGMLTTAFLLLSYYIFVIKCCLLNWHNSDVLRRLTGDSRRQHHHRLIIDDVDRLRSAAAAAGGGGGGDGGGLDESTIQAIRTLRFRNSRDSSSSLTEEPSMFFRECAVCLNEFQEEEKMRMLPNCYHLFHIDCIDTWLHNHSNCPLCRADITPHSVVLALLDAAPATAPPTPRPRPDQSTTSAAGLQIQIVLAVADHDRADHEPNISYNSHHNYSSSSSSSNYVFMSNKLETKMMMKNHHVQRHSMGDECIGLSRGKADNVQAMRRSFSMDSSCDRQQLYMAVREILQQNPHFRGAHNTQEY